MFLRTLAALAAISLMIGCSADKDTTPTTGSAEAEQVQTDAAPAVNSTGTSASPETANDSTTPETTIETNDCSEAVETSSDTTVESGC